MRGWKASPAQVALGVVALVVAVSWYGRGDYDLHAFYCAGRALDHHADPYRFGYLARCQGQLHAIPAPLPGYDLVFFAILARLPFDWANPLYLAASTAAVAVAAFCLVRLTALPAPLVVTALFLSDYFVSINSGQIVSFAVAFVALSAWLAESGRPKVAGLAAVGTLIEPHVGLGACIALAWALPRARWPIALACAALAAISIAGLGWNLQLEYISEVLPKHAASEIAHQSQLSLTHLVHVAGFGDRAALVAGTFSFAMTLVAGVLLGVRLSGERAGLAFAVALPPALSLIGGTYIHANQMCLALPAALLAYARFPRWRTQCAFAICLLAIPWSEASIVTGQAVATVLTISVLAFYFTAGARLATLCAAASAALILWSTRMLLGPPNFEAVRTFRPAVTWNGFVDDEWRQFVAVEFSDHMTFYMLLALLTWCGLGLLAYVLVRAAGRKAPA